VISLSAEQWATLSQARRIVVKVGTSTLTHRTGKLDLSQVEKLVRELADVRNQEREVLLVTSGAIGAGAGKLGLKQKPRTIPEKQAAAAVGQGVLLHMYEKLFAEYGAVVAQVLLTREDIVNRKRYLNVRYALSTLLQYGVIPIINENDTVVVDEIRFGDNDTLAALVAGLIDADLLILLSDIEGLYTSDPRADAGAHLIETIEAITPEIEKLAGGVGSEFGSGGMETKIQAAKNAMDSGVHMVIANGRAEGVIRRILSGQGAGTLFVPGDRLHSRKRWIAYGSRVQGKVVVDDGARRAIINSGKSLLPSGILRVDGRFDSGHVVSVVSAGGKEFARGVVNYSSEQVSLIRGKQTREIGSILGYKDYDEVIHRDHMTVTVRGDGSDES
jgi:glutamate 5-kinase